MRHSLFCLSLGAIAAIAAASVSAAPVTVLPAQIGNAATTNQWYRANVTGGGSAAVTATYTPAGESGSLQFAGTGNGSKADVQFDWGVAAAAANGYTFGNLTALSYDWMRAGGTSTGHFAPVLRLFYDLDGNAATTADRGTMIWEAIYNGYNAANIVAGAWNSTNAMTGNLWQITTDPHSNAVLAGLGFTQNNQINIYDYDLSDWMNTSLSKTESAPNGGTTGDTLTANTVIYGMNVGIGSGWSGSFQGAVDHITIGFGGNSTTWNFETQLGTVPEPGSLALAALALAALAGTGLRARRKG